MERSPDSEYYKQLGQLNDTGPEKPFLPGKPMKLSKFVTDTIFPATGGSFKINQARGFSPLGDNNWALTKASPTDTGVVFYREPTSEVLAHEAGHVLDHRHLAAKAFGDASAGMEKYRHPNDYFGSDRNEYVAQAFAKALLSGRKGFSDSTQVERDMPGTLSIIRYLQTQPPFAK